MKDRQAQRRHELGNLSGSHGVTTAELPLDQHQQTEL